MKRFSIALTLLAALVLVVGIASNVAAEPDDFRLVDPDDWSTAYQDGQISPVLEWDEPLEGLHPDGEGTFCTPQLYVMDSLVDGETGETLDDNPGLVMAWGDTDPSLPDPKVVTAAWQLPQFGEPALERGDPGRGSDDCGC